MHYFFLLGGGRKHVNTHSVTCSVLMSHIRTVSWNKNEIAQGVPRSHVNVLGALRCSELNREFESLRVSQTPPYKLNLLAH